ncbi:MAG: polysaccharide biosynthesis/export family protein [Weeksellaceae bacterium]|jgi:polysaccharide export outer membrane protein|nr:polysaccharide biosynthesis/export family protein [Weeksellaceae bacterium]
MKVPSFPLDFKTPMFLMTVLMILSCVPREKIVYFQGDTNTVELLTEKYSAVIQPDDLLDITVFGRDVAATRIFNQESNKGGQQTYLVDEEGYIEFPVLGRIKLAGLTRNEAIQYMKGMLSNEIIDPGVSIKITNYRITVLGEVKSPGSYELEYEKVTLIDALGMAGDLTIDALRNNILVIREENGERNFYRVDLTSNEIFNSPVFYLAQNDVIYVEPSKRKINSSTNTIRDISFVMSVTSFLITLITVLTR